MIEIMDGRAFNNVDDAVVLDTANSVKEAERRAKNHGSMKKFEVALVKDNDVMWELYT